MNNKNDKKSGALIWVILHILLAVLSLSGVCSKMAAGEKFLSLRWCLFYGMVLLILGIYAIGWQQVIKRLPLTVAYANRAVSVIWGCIFGVIFFSESITPGKIIGGVLVIIGVVLYAIADSRETVQEKTCAEEGENV